MEKNWRGLPYFGISEFYRHKFGGKVYKIPVSVVESCPNREGLKGMETCLFCDVWGSSANAESLQMSLQEQIELYYSRIQKKYNAQQFLIYFQAYTNSFSRLRDLKLSFEVASQYDFVKGFVVGTRPDCISKGVLDLWQSYHEKSFLSVELGVQSFFEDQLEFVKRGHTAQQSLDAIRKISQQTQVDIGIHLMFGLPFETDERIIQTAQIINELPISNVKLHNLHVLKNTGLEKLYHSGEFTPICREAYTQKVELFLKHLSPNIYIHRLSAYSSRWEELISPAWTSDKMGTHQYIIDYLRSHKSYQSQEFITVNAEQEQKKTLLSLRAEPLFAQL